MSIWRKLPKKLSQIKYIPLVQRMLFIWDNSRGKNRFWEITEKEFHNVKKRKIYCIDTGPRLATRSDQYYYFMPKDPPFSEMSWNLILPQILSNPAHRQRNLNKYKTSIGAITTVCWATHSQLYTGYCNFFFAVQMRQFRQYCMYRVFQFFFSHYVRGLLQLLNFANMFNVAKINLK